jgi:hypothetical protein
METFLSWGIITITSKASCQYNINLSERLCVINQDCHAIQKQIFDHTFEIDLIWEECHASGNLNPPPPL